MIDPTQQAAPGAAPAQQQGATVCIAAQPDGTFMVYPEGGEAQAQPAQDIDGALEAAKQLLGGAQDPAATEAQADNLFQAGFNGANPRAPKG